MNDPQALRRLLRSHLTIPTMPVIVQRIEKLLRDPNTGTAEVGSLVAEDAPLAAKVLRIANSSYYGLASRCISTEQASTVLGLRVLKNLVTQVSVISQFDHIEAETGFDVALIWDHSTLTAQLAALMTPLCSKIRVITADEAYVCGLLHKVGQMILLDHVGPPYAQMLKKAAQTAGDAYAFGMERKMLGYTHKDVGALLATRWSLPTPIVDAIQLHGTSLDQVGTQLHVHLITIASQAVRHCMQGDLASANGVLQQDASALGMDRGKAMDLLNRIGLSGDSQAA